jgi:hypothetical protein
MSHLRQLQISNIPPLRHIYRQIPVTVQAARYQYCQSRRQHKPTPFLRTTLFVTQKQSQDSHLRQPHYTFRPSTSRRHHQPSTSHQAFPSSHHGHPFFPASQRPFVPSSRTTNIQQPSPNTPRTLQKPRGSHICPTSP